MVFLPFSSVLSWKCISHTYLAAVQILNIPSKPISSFIIAKSVTFTFQDVLWPWRHQWCLSSNSEKSKYLNWYFLCCFFPCQNVISAVLRYVLRFFAVFTLNMFFQQFSGFSTSKYINHTYLVTVYTLTTSTTPHFLVYNLEKPNIYL